MQYQVLICRVKFFARASNPWEIITSNKVFYLYGSRIIKNWFLCFIRVYVYVSRWDSRVTTTLFSTFTANMRFIATRSTADAQDLLDDKRNTRCARRAASQLKIYISPVDRAATSKRSPSTSLRRPVVHTDDRSKTAGCEWTERAAGHVPPWANVQSVDPAILSTTTVNWCAFNHRLFTAR